MKPILYGQPFSPAVRAVLMLSKELNVEIEFKLVDLLKGEHKTPEFLKMNPMHTIPVMQHEDVVITDSHAILMYLVDKFAPDAAVFPKDLTKRTEIINKLMFNAAFFFRRLTDITRPLFMEGAKDIAKHEANIHEAYDILEVYLGNSEFVAGSQFSIADLAVVANTSSIEVFFPISEEKYPNITRWYKQMQKLPYYAEENQKGTDSLRGIIQHLLSK